MAIPFSDNLSISGKYPDITRQEYATLADLKAVKKNRMPEMYFGYCLEDHKWYTFDKQNSEDSVTGYWREFTGGGDAKDIAYNNTDKPELTNVKLALDDLIAKVYYVEPQVTSFTMTPSTTDYEIGQ